MILSIEEMQKEREKLKSDGKKLVFTNGCFDILHKGHVAYIKEAKAQGDKLLIAVNSDDSVKRLKGPNRPVNKQDDRAYVIDNIKSVDYVIIFKEDTPYNVIQKLIPDVLVKGGDWKEEEIVGSDIVKSSGGIVKSLTYIPDYSTTETLRKLNET